MDPSLKTDGENRKAKEGWFTRVSSSKLSPLIEWRTKILNSFLIFVSIVAGIMTIVSFFDALNYSDRWTSFLIFAIFEAILVILAFGKNRIDHKIRAWGVLIVPYLVGITALVTSGLGSSGRIYLIAVPIGALVLIGARSAIIWMAISVLTMLGATWMAYSGMIGQYLVADRNSTLVADWLTEDMDTLGLLLAIMFLLILFYHFLLRLVQQQTLTQEELQNIQLTLEDKVASRTEEVRLNLLNLERRNNELTMLNRIGDAMRRSVDIHEMSRLAGDNLRLFFSCDVVSIMIVDEEQQLITPTYEYDQNEGGYLSIVEPFPIGKGLTSKVIQTRKPMLLATLEEEIANGAYFPPELLEKSEGALTQSWLGVPLLANERVLGVVFLGDYKPYVFNADHLSLLETICAGLAVTFDNARLFQAEQQRIAELYMINRVQNSLASRLDLKSIYRLIGEQTREVFGVNVVDIVVFDEHTGNMVMPYSYEDGDESVMNPRPPYGFRKKVLESGEPILINDHFESVALAMDNPLVTGSWPKSALFMPLRSGHKTLGVISIQDMKSEKAFSPESQRLLQTLANSMTVAMENARLFEEARKARNEAEQANHAKSAFLANMSHELRTPLNAIIGFTRIVRRKSEGLLPDKQIENLDKVLISSEHLLNLINTVLDIAKIEAGRMDVLPANFRVQALVDLCAHTSQPLFKPEVTFTTEVDDNLGIAFSDQDKIRQIVLNLLSNAAKFTPQGQVTLRAKLADEGTLQIQVEDTGIGIAPEAMDRIFREFQQADSTTTRQYGGTGLGLAISRNLAHLLGGEITVRSKLGQGSEFTLSLPLQYTAPQSSSQNIAGIGETSISKPSETNQADHPKPVVLVIDNDPDAVYLMQESIGSTEYEIIGAPDGQTGLDLARNIHPAAILLEIALPGISGWQVLHELRQEERTHKIPVILLTIVDKKALGFGLGAADYLLKPLDPDKVRDAIHKALGQNMDDKFNILVVDDDPLVYDLISQTLPENQFHPSYAVNGKDALQMIQSSQPQLLLLDLIMPVMDGFELIKILRADPATQGLPIIVISGKDLTTKESELLRQTVSITMKKQDFERDKLVGSILSVLKASLATAMENQ